MAAFMQIVDKSFITAMDMEIDSRFDKRLNPPACMTPPA